MDATLNTTFTNLLHLLTLVALAYGSLNAGWGFINWIHSGDDDRKLAKARGRVTHALVGAGGAILAGPIATTVLAAIPKAG
jgi:hypothetical protein